MSACHDDHPASNGKAKARPASRTQDENPDSYSSETPHTHSCGHENKEGACRGTS